jgi:Trk K+ transport system NAD-binding subunit
LAARRAKAIERLNQLFDTRVCLPLPQLLNLPVPVVRERTGCSVVAVERGDDVIVDLGPGFRFQPEDAVYLCGSNNALRRFREVFGPRPSRST